MRRNRLAWVILAGVAACSSDGGDGGGMGVTTGTVSGSAMAGGAGVAGVVMTLERGTATRTATTSATGGFTFSAVEAGSWTLEISPPTGFDLAAGQAASVSVTVTAGQTTTTNVQLQEEQTGGGGATIINLAGTSFSDDDVTISEGETVRWVYQSGGPHTVTPDGHSEWEEAGLDAAGETFEHTFNTAGDYPYFCVPHQPNMTGIIRVVP